jgi:hypothetical protein
MSNHLRMGLVALALAVSVFSAGAAELKPTADVPLSWKAFWASVHVEPAPPRNFLDGEFDGRVDNLTNGKLSDATVRKWVLANLRRGRGDSYAGHHLRDDIANAGIFGPPGLNGTGDTIRTYRERNIDHIESPLAPKVVAAAVIAVPKQEQARNPRLALTDYVIVIMYRMPPGAMTTVYRDGRRELVLNKRKEMYWQLDTGHFFQHSTLGPLWYQKMGWSCVPDGSVIGQYCGLVKP